MISSLLIAILVAFPGMILNYRLSPIKIAILQAIALSIASLVTALQLPRYCLPYIFVAYLFIFFIYLLLMYKKRKTV